jgi:hypothetical protein
MPWIASNIDLSFPDINKQVELDTIQNPQIESYYPLAYQRKKDQMRMDKNVLKVQNMTFSQPQQV